jgi:hypothetical protein
VNAIVDIILSRESSPSKCKLVLLDVRTYYAYAGYSSRLCVRQQLSRFTAVLCAIIDRLHLEIVLLGRSKGIGCSVGVTGLSWLRNV